jgi:DNA mismatch endonuclease (patch repair protein)
MPKSREDYWITKIKNNISKDKEVVSKLRKLGWNVFTIWECQLKENKAEKTLTTLLNKILSSASYS